MPYQTKPINVEAGVSPSSDTTSQSTTQWVFTDKVRFKGGLPEKIGGWDTLSLNGNYPITGVTRNVFSYVMNKITYYLIGTHSNLYSIVGNTLFNATPVQITPISLNNALSSNYRVLGNNPFRVNTGSFSVTVTDNAHKFINGDIVQFSGASGFAGLTSAQLNGAKSISNITANTYQFNVSTMPSSTANGGGASINRSSRIVTISQSNSYKNGDNIVISNLSSPVGGIPVADIEGISVIRRASATSYDIVSTAFATSSQMSAGGTVNVFPEILDGQQNSTSGGGYGLGQYGVGLYGVSKQSTNASSPSIWSFDRFGDLIVATQGNGTAVYSWNNSSNTIPAPILNSPAQVNYIFTTDNILVTLGAMGVPNRIKWSDLGNLTVWNATAQNRAGEDDIEGVGEFISHAKMRGLNLLFTRSSVHSFRYIDKPNVFEIKEVDPSRGLIARNARVVVNGTCYWMGTDNFYMYRGGNVETMPSNVSNECTLKQYVFDNIDPVNQLKAFAWYNASYNEIWFHYPSVGSEECDRIMRYNVLDRTCAPDTMERTAGEYPTVLGVYPYLSDKIGTTSVIYRHENGYDDNGAPLAWQCTSPYFSTGAKDTLYLGGVYQDNYISNGNINLTINTKRYPNQDAGSRTYPISTQNANLIYRMSARYWQYSVSGNTLGQAWRCGSWQELVKQGSKR